MRVRQDFAQIYGIYLHYVAPEDVHVYSIDECFIDCTAYLHAYRKEAEKQGTNPAHLMAITMIREVLRTTGITATVGIGTNLYLAKVAMDIVAREALLIRIGVRIAELNEDSYKFLLWEHKTTDRLLADRPGKARRLLKACMFTMGDIATAFTMGRGVVFTSSSALTVRSCMIMMGYRAGTMQDIKSYRFEGHSFSNGQVLRDRSNIRKHVVFREMIEVLCTDMFPASCDKRCSWWVSYDYKSLEPARL
jgi:DNA polymerase V